MRSRTATLRAIVIVVATVSSLFGLMAGPAFAPGGPNANCDGTVERGGGPPRCVESEPGGNPSGSNENWTTVTESQWHGGEFQEGRTCVYNPSGNLHEPSSDEGCPEQS